MFRLTKRHRNGRWFWFAILAVFSCFFISDSGAASIRSQAGVAVDATTGEILFSKNPHLLLLPASTAKVITAILALEHKPLSEIVTISRNAAKTPPFKAGFKEGDRIRVEGLLYAALLKSSNDAAVALAEAVAGSEEQFVLLMNDKAVSIGATATKFINATGLPGPDQHITALDLSAIMGYAMKHPRFREIVATPLARISTEAGRTFLLKNTDKLLWMDQGVVGGKTGYTDSAKHCFVGVAEREDKSVIVALLGSPTRKTLWREAESLIGKAFEVITPERVRGAGLRKEPGLAPSSF